MERGPQGARPLPEEHADFIRTGVSIVVASRAPDLRPSVSRAAGCRISDDRMRVTVLLRPSRSELLIRDLRACGVVSVVFTQPSTHRTIQLKGSDAVLEDPAPGDAGLVRAYTAAFGDELETYGYPIVFTQAMIDSAPQDLVALRFTPTAVFGQTPGPRAGERLS